MRTFIVLATLFLFSAPLHAETLQKPAANKERIVNTVRFLSEENSPRSAIRTNKEKTIHYIAKSLSAAGLEVTHDEFETAFHEDTFTNIHALKKGKTNKRIVIGAHYDIVPESPGADDNASGVAVLLELAFMLKEISQLNCDVEFVSYDAEELGLLGSRFHAKQLKEQKIDIVCMLAMDLVGYYSDKENSQGYPVPGMSLLYGTKGNFLTMIGRAEDTKLLADAQKVWQEATTLRVLSLPTPKGLDLLLSRSDHAPFWWAGYPALFFTDTADFRNKNYHEKTDTWNTLDYDRLAQVPIGLYHVVLMIDMH